MTRPPVHGDSAPGATDPEPLPHLHDIRSRDDIARFVDAFYSRAMGDEVIGYIFTEVARLDLEAHLPVMYDFWESLLLGARSYGGGAMQKHIELHRATPLRTEHFERWLLLFETTVTEFFMGERATSAILAARNIARSMSLRMEHADRAS